MITDERKKALDIALSQIEKNFGKGSVMKLGEVGSVNVDAIPTGALSLDIALGIGGVPRGRIIEVFGPESSGKTTVALHMVAEIQKRGGIAAIEELNDCIPADSTVEAEYENGVLAAHINAFLASLSQENRVIFLRRYFFSHPIPLIAKELGISEGKVKTVLFRLRVKLRERLEAEKLL